MYESCLSFFRNIATSFLFTLPWRSPPHRAWGEVADTRQTPRRCCRPGSGKGGERVAAHTPARSFEAELMTGQTGVCHHSYRASAEPSCSAAWIRAWPLWLWDKVPRSATRVPGLGPAHWFSGPWRRRWRSRRCSSGPGRPPRWWRRRPAASSCFPGTVRSSSAGVRESWVFLPFMHAPCTQGNRSYVVYYSIV